ncbi:hypothetical protein GIB67_021266 [Kingdonia uniflora]|uniref:Transcription factor MYC/MYB N-terminal domain-containing protein n=1 Tax=Kingdonia uniflora TaxID=39325 RepID=A0A7J7LFY9_9MAGN|nr:hypothetical protein GIB67_021266 [Kingdonia uniflora]
MEEHYNPLAVSHLLQHTLRSLCVHEDSQWVYAVFWRILPRNYPPPKWDIQGGAYDRSRGNMRNWILVWEDGFYNFSASMADIDSGDWSHCGASYATDGQVFPNAFSLYFFVLPVFLNAFSLDFFVLRIARMTLNNDARLND